MRRHCNQDPDPASAWPALFGSSTPVLLRSSGN